MIPIRDDKELSNLINGLSNDVVNAKVHWTLLQDLHNALFKNPLVVAQANTFWSLTIDAHSATAIAHLTRAYDQINGALCLRSFLATIKDNLAMFDRPEFERRLADNPHMLSLSESAYPPDLETLEADMVLCSATDPLVKKLIAYRGNVVSHRNARTAVLGQRGAIPPASSEIEALLDRAVTILNKYSLLFSASSYSTRVVGGGDFDYIITTISEAVKLSHSTTLAQIERLKAAVFVEEHA